MSLLSTTMGPEYEPLLPNRVVNLQQTKSGAQCRAYGQWTGPQTYQCNAELLGDIASHPQLRQHYQLAHVGQPVANSRSHTKMISFHKRTLTNVWHSQWGWQANIRQCATPLHTPLVLWQSVLEDSAQLPLGNTVTCLATIHSIPRGNVENERNPTEEREVPIPSQDGLAAYRERWYQNPLMLVPGVQNIDSARGTEHLWFHGHISNCGTTEHGHWISAGQVNLSFFCCSSHSRSELGLGCLT